MGEKQGHTPGPLTAKEYPDQDSWHIHTHDGGWIATVHIDGEPRTAKADAALFAAAPDLLAALSDILPPTLCGESWDLPDHDAVPITITFGKLRAARAAISRATGEDSPANSQPQEHRP